MKKKLGGGGGFFLNMCGCAIGCKNRCAFAENYQNVCGVRAGVAKKPRTLRVWFAVKLTLLEILVGIHSQSMMVDLHHLTKLVNFVEIHSHLIRSSPQAINCCFILKQIGLELFLDFRLVTTA